MPSIEELVKQQFADEREKAVISLYVAANPMSAKSEKIIARFGISGPWLNVLRILRGQYPKPSNTRIIKERIVGQKTDLSRIIARLAKAGLIIYYKKITDQRIAQIVISQKGLGVLAKLDKHKEEMLQPLNALSEEETRQLNVLLGKLLNSLKP